MVQWVHWDTHTNSIEIFCKRDTRRRIFLRISTGLSSSIPLRMLGLRGLEGNTFCCWSCWSKGGQWGARSATLMGVGKRGDGPTQNTQTMSGEHLSLQLLLLRSTCSDKHSIKNRSDFGSRSSYSTIRGTFFVCSPADSCSLQCCRFLHQPGSCWLSLTHRFVSQAFTQGSEHHDLSVLCCLGLGQLSCHWLREEESDFPRTFKKWHPAFDSNNCSTSFWFQKGAQSSRLSSKFL